MSVNNRIAEIYKNSQMIDSVLFRDFKPEIIARWMHCETQEEIAAAVGVSQPYVAKIVKNITEGQMSDGDIFANFKPEIIARWMRCESPQEIAEVVSMSRQYVEKIVNNATDSHLTDGSIFRDFKPEIYTVWNFGKSTNAVKHFGNIPPEILGGGA